MNINFFQYVFVVYSVWWVYNNTLVGTNTEVIPTTENKDVIWLG